MKGCASPSVGMSHVEQLWQYMLLCHLPRNCGRRMDEEQTRRSNEDVMERSAFVNGSHVCVPNSVMYVLTRFYVTCLRLSANN